MGRCGFGLHGQRIQYTIVCDAHHLAQEAKAGSSGYGLGHTDSAGFYVITKDEGLSAVAQTLGIVHGDSCSIR